MNYGIAFVVDGTQSSGGCQESRTQAHFHSSSLHPPADVGNPPVRLLHRCKGEPISGPDWMHFHDDLLHLFDHYMCSGQLLSFTVNVQTFMVTIFRGLNF